MTAAPPACEALLPVYRPAPVPIVRGAGIVLTDAHGRSYLDFTSGLGVNALGYADAGIAHAVRAAIESGVIHLSNLYRAPPAEALARALVSHSFADRVFFCNSGAEANEAAFKFARCWARAAGGAGKHQIVALRGAFHGRLFASLAATDRPAYRAPFRPLAGGILVAERDLSALDALVRAETTAAVIVEPVQGEGGVRVLEPTFLQALRALTRERGVALILDEVQCGLGRTGVLFAHERAGVTPDLLTLAKPLAGGLPMGAVLVTADVAAAMEPGLHGTTFGGGPLVASVALHVLERLADPALLASVRENGAWLAGALADLAMRTGCIRAVRGIGYIWGLDVHELAAVVVERARGEGLFICSAGAHTVRLLPPLVTTRAELARGLALLERALRPDGAAALCPLRPARGATGA